MFIVITGGSTTAEYLIGMMLEQNHRIVVIEEEHEAVEHLSVALPPEVLIVEGDGTDPSVQLDAGVDSADLFIALMGHDDANLVACEIAMTAFNVPRCIASVNSPKNNRIFREVGIEPVSSTELIARMVEEEAIVGDMRMVFSLREGDIVMVETKLPTKMRHHDGVRVADIPFTENTQLIAVIRDEDFVMINGDTVLMPGETVIAATKSSTEDQFRAVMRHL
ncbi:MAG: potassium channel family protein [Coriobacteriales bacterium]|jgi:trk system potassium uptake protein TrkA